LFNGANQIAGASYDAAGNLTYLTGSNLTYDAENRLTGATQSGVGSMYYSYDGAGRRVQEISTYNTEKVFVYDVFGRLSAEYSVGTPAPPCSTCYIATDHLSSTRLVTDQNGNTVGRHDYVPLGEEIAANTGGRDGTFGTQDFVNQKFTGQERDAETGLDFFQARYFSGALGRFNSPDPANAGADIFNPQSWNAYSYVVNNPPNTIDPLGLAPQSVGGGCTWDPDTNTLSCGSTGVSGCVSQGTQGCIRPPCMTLGSNCGDSGYSGPPNGGGGGGGGGKGAAAEAPPNNGTRPNWLNNIVSIFGYDQRINLPSCAAIAFKTAGDDLNPFLPSSADAAQGALNVGQAAKFNQALTYAAAKDLTYPNKSSVFRGILNTSKTLGKVADTLALANLDYALTDGLITEIKAMNQGQCQ
jgi:RHS repeat-associated protein